MKIAVLLKFDEKDEFLLSFLQQRLLNNTSEIHFVHVDKVSGEVPLQIDGRVLDNCTEFDLSKHYAAVEQKKEELNQKLASFPNKKIIVVAGNPIHFITNYIKGNTFDMVYSGSHVTDWIEAMEHSFATQLVHHTNTPVFTLKCDRTFADFNRIGVVIDEKQMSEKAFQQFDKISRSFESEVVFLSTPRHASEQPTAPWRQAFQNSPVITIGGDLGDHDFYKCTNDQQIDLLVIFRHQLSKWQSLFQKPEEDRLINHLELPIVIL